MMFLLLVHDSSDRGSGCGVSAFEHLQLLPQVRKNNSFHGDRGSHNRAAAEEASDQANAVPAGTAKKVASATPDSPLPQLSSKDLAVPLLMNAKLLQLRYERRRREPGHQELSRIDVHGAVLSRMVHFENSAAQSVGGQHSRA